VKPLPGPENGAAGPVTSCTWRRQAFSGPWRAFWTGPSAP
jgi:hypothetical protein